MRLIVPDVEAARALARTWAEGASAVTEWGTAPLYEAERRLRAGLADLAFVPALAVLRDPDAFSVVPGVGLVGGAGVPARLAVFSALDRIRRVGFDPHFAQEALLAQVLLKELYDAQPVFVPLGGGAVPADPSAGSGQALDAELRVGGDAPEAGYVMDLAHEWFELTTRPFVWALLAAPVGTVEPHEAQRLRDAALELDPERMPGTDPAVGGVTLAAYAHAGLEDWVKHLFYHRALDDMPAIPFVELPEEDDEGGE